MRDDIMKIASGELGIKEIKGTEHNPRILEYQQITGLQFGDDETPWCSIFTNWVAKQAGVPMSGKADARSWLKVGTPTEDPKPGDVVIFWRGSLSGWQGHVGFFVGFDHTGKNIYVLGGNQRDEVNITEYSTERVLGYRNLVIGVGGDMSIPKGYLRRGDSNANVKRLQLLLIEFGFLTGSADGVFGPKTEAALRKMQREHNITVDGIYGSQSRAVLVELKNRQD